MSQHLIKLYNECMQGNYSNVERLRLKYSHVDARNIGIKGEEHNSVSSSEVDEDESGGDSEEADNNEDLDRDLMEVDHVICKTKVKEPIIDEEGFQLVTRRKR